MFFWVLFLRQEKYLARRGDDDRDVVGRAMQERLPRPGNATYSLHTRSGNGKKKAKVPGMTDTNAKAFEEKLLTIDLIDGLRREQERLDLALSDGEQMKALRTQIQAYYQQAGITVSDALIDQAIAERQAQRNTFKPNKLSALGRAIATGYVYRRRIGIGLTALAAITVFAWFLDRQISAWQNERELSAYRATLQQQLERFHSAQQAAAGLPAELPALSSEQIPALPQWSQQLQLDFAQAKLALNPDATCATLAIPAELTMPWSGETALNHCADGSTAVQSAATQAQQTVRAHQQLATAVQQYELLTQRIAATPVLGTWRAVNTALATATSNTAIGSDRQAFVSATEQAAKTVETIAGIAGSHERSAACLREASSQAAGDDKAALETLLGAGLAFRDAEQIAGVAEWTNQAEQTCTFFKSPITLRIVSERGEKTGVWREYDGKRGARTYYIIVDALGVGGAAFTTRIQSVEDQKSYQRERFGVQVDERTFEAIKRDKQDDGLLEQPDIGKKPANSLRWQLQPGFDAKFIAEW